MKPDCKCTLRERESGHRIDCESTPTPPPEAARPTKETDAAYLAMLEWAAKHGHERSVEQKLTTILEDPRPATGWQVARKIEAERDALRVALADLMKLRNTIEAMGEWSALDMNRSFYKRESEKVAAAMEQARKLIPKP